MILHIDDDEDDLSVFKDALTLLDIPVTLRQEKNAELAFSFLQSARAKHELPCLIVVDLNMPGISGKELIAMIRNQPHLDAIPIFAFTTSTLPSDKDYCACFQVKCITKPLYFEHLKNIISDMLAHCNLENIIEPWCFFGLIFVPAYFVNQITQRQIAPDGYV